MDCPAPADRGRGLRTSRREGVPGGERNGGQLAVARRALPAMGCGAVSRLRTHPSQRVRSDIDVLGWRRHARAFRQWLAPRRRLDPGRVREHPLGRSSPFATRRVVAHLSDGLRCRVSRRARRRACRHREGTRPTRPSRWCPHRQRHRRPRLQACRADLAGRSRRGLARRHQERRAQHRCDRVLRPRGRGATRVSDQARRSRCIEDAVPVRPARGVSHRWTLASSRVARQRSDGPTRRRVDGVGGRTRASRPKRTWRLPRSIRRRSIGWKPTGCSSTAWHPARSVLSRASRPPMPTSTRCSCGLPGLFIDPGDPTGGSFRGSRRSP